jgi:hypothetical protein
VPAVCPIDEPACAIAINPTRVVNDNGPYRPATFPKHASLWVMVGEGKEIDRLTYAPIGARQGNFHAYKFPMPGLAFSMAVSKNIPANHRARCLFTVLGTPSS